MENEYAKTSPLSSYKFLMTLTKVLNWFYNGSENVGLNMSAFYVCWIANKYPQSVTFMMLKAVIRRVSQPRELPFSSTDAVQDWN